MSKKSMMALAVFGAMSALCMPLFAAKTLYVVPPDTPNHTPASPYGSWETAATSIADAANGDYHLQPKSPLREGGMLLDWMTAGAVDLDGNPRVHLDLPDIGCYESQFTPLGLMVFFR